MDWKMLSISGQRFQARYFYLFFAEYQRITASVFRFLSRICVLKIHHKPHVIMTLKLHLDVQLPSVSSVRRSDSLPVAQSGHHFLFLINTCTL